MGSHICKLGTFSYVLGTNYVGQFFIQWNTTYKRLFWNFENFWKLSKFRNFTFNNQNFLCLKTRTRPRVKSNILASKRRNKFKEKERGKTRNKVNFKDNINFVSKNDKQNEIFNNNIDSGGKCNNPFKCPPTKPADGRKPRVKSNIKAR